MNQCYVCNKEIEGKPKYLEVYHSAFDETGTEVDICKTCYEEYYEPEGFFLCDWCQRIVAESYGPNNHYRHVEDEIVCLKCYEKDILKNGLPIESFEEGKLQGMFFSSGNSELKEAGWKEVDEFDNYFISSPMSIQLYCEKAVQLIKEGWMVITGYESLSIVGDEGYVTMFKKKLEEF